MASRVSPVARQHDNALRGFGSGATRLGDIPKPNFIYGLAAPSSAA